MSTPATPIDFAVALFMEKVNAPYCCQIYAVCIVAATITFRWEYIFGDNFMNMKFMQVLMTRR